MRKTDKVKFVQTKGFLLLVALFIFILILTFFFGDSGIIEIVGAQRKIAELKNRIVHLEKEKKRLAKEIEELENNPNALERRAREKLWLMTKNEMVIVLTDNHNLSEK